MPIHINLVGQYSSSTSPLSMVFLVRTKVAFLCFVCFELDRGQLIKNRIQCWLSWCRILCSAMYHCASMKYFVRGACGRISSVPTVLISVELLVFVFPPKNADHGPLSKDQCTSCFHHALGKMRQ